MEYMHVRMEVLREVLRGIQSGAITANDLVSAADSVWQWVRDGEKR